MLNLITAALQGMAAIPKILDFLKDLNLQARLEKLEANEKKMADAYDLLNKATTSEEKDAALKAIGSAWKSRSTN